MLMVNKAKEKIINESIDVPHCSRWRCKRLEKSQSQDLVTWNATFWSLWMRSSTLRIMNLNLLSIDIHLYQDAWIQAAARSALSHYGSNEFRQEPVPCEPTVRPLLWQVWVHHAHLPDWLTIVKTLFEGTNNPLYHWQLNHLKRRQRLQEPAGQSQLQSQAQAASVCGCWPSRSPASQSLSRLMWQWLYFSTPWWYY